MRFKYYDGDKLSTIIEVDYREQTVEIENFTDDNISRAFGVNESPTFQDFEDFLESRCFPRTRDKMKLILRELGLDCYDPLSIVQVTKGVMADDQMWLDIVED